MDKQHFVLIRRYKAVLKNGITVGIKLCPENFCYFESQKMQFLIRAIRAQEDLDINDIDFIQEYFIPKETAEEVEIHIGL